MFSMFALARTPRTPRNAVNAAILHAPARGGIRPRRRQVTMHQGGSDDGRAGAQGRNDMKAVKHGSNAVGKWAMVLLLAWGN
jgi:hypothetical protein